jgi:hypothetical protein
MQQSTFEPAPTLRGTGLVLRPPKPEDKQARLAAGRQPEIVRMYGGDPSNLAPLTPEDVDRWYAWLSALVPGG